MGQSELSASVQSLESGSVNQPHLVWSKLDVAVDSVPNDFHLLASRQHIRAATPKSGPVV